MTRVKLVVVTLFLFLAGCATEPSAPPQPPSVPIAGLARSKTDFQRVTADGALISVDGNYSLLVKKMNDGDPDLKSLDDYGLPITVVFVNRSANPITFGPDSLSVTDASGTSYALLSEEDIKQDEDAGKSSLFGQLMDVAAGVAEAADIGQMANAGVITQGEAGDLTSLAATVMANSLADDQNSDAAISEDEDRLLKLYGGVVLNTSQVGPNSHVGGVILVKNASPSTDLVITVTTGSVQHVLRFGPPPSGD